MKIHELFALEQITAKGKCYPNFTPISSHLRVVLKEAVWVTHKSEEERLHKEICDNSQITEGLMNRITNMDRNIQVMPKYIKSCDTSDEKNYAKMNN